MTPQLVTSAVQNLQSSDATILLTGESGTGKEVLAKAIHAHSTRKNGRFVAVNVAVMPAALVVEHAAAGTLFLADIDDTPLSQQGELLGLLEKLLGSGAGQQS